MDSAALKILRQNPHSFTCDDVRPWPWRWCSKPTHKNFEVVPSIKPHGNSLSPWGFLTVAIAGRCGIIVADCGCAVAVADWVIAACFSGYTVTCNRFAVNCSIGKCFVFGIGRCSFWWEQERIADNSLAFKRQINGLSWWLRVKPTVP